jgi:HPt (histidine-containing phosphotransfer) domain-containing protein
MAGTLAREDLTLLSTMAHTMKGMLASIAFKEAAALAAELESMAKRGAAEGIAERIARIDSSVRRSLVELEKFCQVGARSSSS